MLTLMGRQVHFLSVSCRHIQHCQKYNHILKEVWLSVSKSMSNGLAFLIKTFSLKLTDEGVWPGGIYYIPHLHSVAAYVQLSMEL